MSLTNDQVTAKNFEKFYDRIYPYLNGAAHAGFTPVGTVISIMGNHAPQNYLSCEGQVVNISDYPELANYFEQEFGTKNNFGGDGTTTFAVPDLRGEFLRGTGTNSHTNQGSGANVGEHQDGTEIPFFNSYINGTSGNFYTGDSGKTPNKYDSYDSGNNYYRYVGSSRTTSTSNVPNYYTSRPTNTSVLYCIATKDIYVDARFDYSTSEKVVGKWIDGKPIYQRTFSFDNPSKSTDISLVSGSWLSDFVGGEGLLWTSIGDVKYFPYCEQGPNRGANVSRYQDDIRIYFWDTNNTFTYTKLVVTVRYTKTTD